MPANPVNMFDLAKARLMEVRYATPEMVERRRIVLEATAVRTGERAIDVGTGPGFVAGDLAERVGPGGFVAAVDRSPEMVAFARERLGRAGLADRVEVRESDAATLPYPDTSFDVFTATQVFEYVSDVERAIAEAYRVLRPGGRLALVDADWATWNWQVDDAERAARVLASWASHCAHQHLPRYLAPLLRQAGFAVESVRVLPVLDLVGSPGTFSATLVESVAGYVRARAEVSHEDVDAWQADLARQVANGTYFFSANQYLFVARRPD